MNPFLSNFSCLFAWSRSRDSNGEATLIWIKVIATWLIDYLNKSISLMLVGESLWSFLFVSMILVLDRDLGWP
jgi:hypothetical protein